MTAQLNNSLIHGITCLQLVASAEQPMGSREVARQLGLSHTRANRLLGTLAHIGLVEQDSSRRYRPGQALHILAAQSMKGSRLLPTALPYLMTFRQEGLTVALGMLWRGQVCYLFHERPWQPLEAAIARHELYPAEKSSLGVALIASTVSAEQAAPNLRQAIEHVHYHGYSVIHYASGEVSIGAAIGQPPLAGIAVSGKHIGQQYIPEIAQRLCAAARQIAAEIEKDLPDRADSA